MRYMLLRTGQLASAIDMVPFAFMKSIHPHDVQRRHQQLIKLCQLSLGSSSQTKCLVSKVHRLWALLVFWQISDIGCFPFYFNLTSVEISVSLGYRRKLHYRGLPVLQTNLIKVKGPVKDLESCSLCPHFLGYQSA